MCMGAKQIYITMILIYLHIDSRRSTRSVNTQGQGRDLPELPKASKRQTNGNMTDSPTREKPRQSRKSSNNKHSNLKDSSDGSKQAQQQLMSTDSQIQQVDGPQAQNLPDMPKKIRRKKSKDNSSGGSSKLRSKVQQSSDPNLDFGSPSSKSRNKPRPFEENEQYERELSRIS